MFVLPSRLEAGRPAPALLDWTTVEQKLPWGVILLLGGGFALADITDKGGRAVSCMCELLLVVKLREREGQRVDLGRSLIGHL